MAVGERTPVDPVAAGPAGRHVARAAPEGRAAVRFPRGDGWLFTAPALDSSVPQLRHAVRDLLRQRVASIGPETADGLLLILSELVTNAVRHAAVLSPQITVEIVVDAGSIRVAVADGHPYRPCALEVDHVRTGGRGLMLVKAITGAAGGSHGAERTPDGGKVVWATLPLGG